MILQKIGEKFEFNQLMLKESTSSAKVITIKQFYEGNLLIQYYFFVHLIDFHVKSENPSYVSYSISNLLEWRFLDELNFFLKFSQCRV